MEIPIKGLTHSTLALFSSYTCPGDVRELRNVLEHVIIFAENGVDSHKQIQ